MNVAGSERAQKTCYEQSHACFGAHRCVISTTGPLAYQAGIGEATHRLQCTNHRRTFRNGQCSNSPSSAMQRVHVCENSCGFNPRDRARLTCNVSWHLDCRNGGIQGLKCQGTHTPGSGHPRSITAPQALFNSAFAPWLRGGDTMKKR